MKTEKCLDDLILYHTCLAKDKTAWHAVRPFTGLICMLILVGCAPDELEPSSTSTTAAEQAVTVQIAEVQVTTLHPKPELVGTIVAIPERTAVVSPQLGGWVRELDVMEGKTVRAGDVLAELDNRSAQVSVRRAKAVVAEKEAVVNRLKSGYLPGEIAAARQDADEAAATVEGLRGELTAVKELLDRHELSPVLYATKAQSLKSAEAAAASLLERVKLLEAGTRPEMIAESVGQLDAARADLEQAELTLQWCSITSPIDGIVVQLQARKGQYFDRAAPLATILDLSEVFAQVRVPSHDFGKVRVGTQVEVQLNAIPNRTFHGSVDRLSGQADPLTGNVVVFAVLQNESHVLTPGLSCLVHVSLPEVPGVLALPTAAVADNSGTPVVTVIRDNKAYETEVETGIETREFVQIISGLSAGDLVATHGGYGLPDGCPVQIATDGTKQ